VKKFERFLLPVIFAFVAVFANFQIANAQTMPLGPYGNIPLYSTNSFTAATATIGALQFSGIVAGSGNATQTLTTDTAANICAAFPFVGSSGAQGWNYIVWLKNVNSGNLTLAAGTGVTLVGTATTPTVNIRPLIVSLVNCSPGSQAVTVFNGPTGAY
jgi:hypothetical protein